MGSPLASGASGASGAKQEMFVPVASVCLTRHYTWILVPGNTAALQTADTQDSGAEKNSLLQLNQGCHAGIKAHRGLAEGSDTPGTCTMSLGCGLFR